MIYVICPILGGFMFGDLHRGKKKDFGLNKTKNVNLKILS